MEPLHTQVITRLQPLLVQTLDVGIISTILDHLILPPYVVTVSDIEAEAPSNTRSKVRWLIGKLKKAGEEKNVLGVLKKALKSDATYRFLLDKVVAEEDEVRKERDCLKRKVKKVERKMCVHCCMLHFANADHFIDILNSKGFINDDYYDHYCSTQNDRTARQNLERVLDLLKDNCLQRKKHLTEDVLVNLIRSTIEKKKSYPMELHRSLENACESDLYHCNCTQLTDQSEWETCEEIEVDCSSSHEITHAFGQTRVGKKGCCSMNQIEEQQCVTSIVSVDSKVGRQLYRGRGANNIVKLCKTFDDLCGAHNDIGVDKFNQFAGQLKAKHPGNHNVETNILIHKMLFEIWGNCNPKKLREWLVEAKEHLAKADGASMLDIHLAVHETRLLQIEGQNARAVECIEGAVQKGETNFNHRVLGFVYEVYAHSLIHQFKIEIVGERGKKLRKHVQNMYDLGYANLIRSQHTIEDEWSLGIGTMIKMCFFLLNTCAAGNFLEEVATNSNDIKQTYSLLQQLKLFYEAGTLSSRLQVRYLLAKSDYELRTHNWYEALRYAMEAKMKSECENVTGYNDFADKRIANIEYMIEPVLKQHFFHNKSDEKREKYSSDD